MKQKQPLWGMVAFVLSLAVFSAAPSHAGGPVLSIQHAEMFSFAGEPARGGGTLTRKKIGVWARLSAADLDPNAAYTVWWVIFNRPMNCIDGCGDDDIFNPDGTLNEKQIRRADISIIYADGFVTGSDGVANITAHLRSGTLPKGWEALFGSGLRWGRGEMAEFHVVWRSHGESVAGVTGLQTSTFFGYCNEDAGENACEDQFFLIFLPLVD